MAGRRGYALSMPLHPARLLALVSFSLLTAAEPPSPKAKAPDQIAYLTAEAAGPDFLLQGEFEVKGTGADIIALGGDQYRLVIFKGGLPGAGWDGSPRQELDGKREGAAVHFAAKTGGSTASLKDGTLLLTLAGAEVAPLHRLVRHSSTENAPAPQGAKVLFDGKNADAWKGGKVDDRGFLRCGTTSKDLFKDYTMHLEFFLPFKPYARGQGRANSGVYHQDRYEVQVLDSFGLKGENNECGGIYTISAPKTNMCYPPLQWQTYDVDFTAAKFDKDGKKNGSAFVTVKHNGAVVQDNLELKGVTPGGAFKTEVPAPGPFYLQGHGNPVVYRNVWVVAK